MATEFALEITMVSTEVALGAIAAGVNDFVATGAPSTVMEVAVTLLVMRAGAAMLALALVYGPPAVFEVTSTVIVHEACALFIEAPATTIVPTPAGIATAPVPDGQVVVMVGAPAANTLAGRLAVKLMPDGAGLPAPLVSVKVSVQMPPWLMVAGENALFNEACTTARAWPAAFSVRTPPTVTLAAAFK